MEALKDLHKRGILRVLVIVCLVILSLSFSSCSKKESEVVGKDDQPQKVEKYIIYKKDDISLDNVKRYVYSVIVNEKLSKSELEKVSNEIVEKVKKEGDFNGIQILMYDGEYAVSGEMMPSLGRYTYAPGGDFAKAMDVKSGEYDKMSALNELKEVDWSLRPSKEIQNIVSIYNELFKTKSESNTDGVIDDNEIRLEAAKILGIEASKVDKALEEVDEWVYQN